MSSGDYPRDRPKYFANKLIRLLQKSCAANDIGIEACWLVTCVALVEDAKHYSGPVTFWTGQLLPITGFNSWGRLDRARDKAVIGGWLHYQAGTNRKCGSYWTLIPKFILLAFDDFPIDEVNHQNGDSSKVNHQNGAHNGDRNVIETGLKRDNAVNLPSLLPVPVPEEQSAPSAPAKSKKTTIDSVAFTQWWEVYPRKTAKEAARKAFAAAMKRITLKHDSVDTATAWLLEITSTFAKSPSGSAGKFTPYPATWLNEGRYEDDQAEWFGTTTGGKASSSNIQLWSKVHAAVMRISEGFPYRQTLIDDFGETVTAAVMATTVRAIKDASDDFERSKVQKTFFAHLGEIT